MQFFHEITRSGAVQPFVFVSSGLQEARVVLPKEIERWWWGESEGGFEFIIQFVSQPLGCLGSAHQSLDRLSRLG